MKFGERVSYVHFKALAFAPRAYGKELCLSLLAGEKPDHEGDVERPAKHVSFAAETKETDRETFP